MALALLAAAPALLAGALLRDARVIVRLGVMGVLYAGAYAGLGEATRIARVREWFEVAGDVMRQR
jgi:hypothetical protein